MAGSVDAVDAFLGADPGAPAGGSAVDAFLASDPHPEMGEGAPIFRRTHPIDRVAEEFNTPLGPTPQTLDQLGFTGASRLLRAPASAALTIGDAGLRLFDAGAKTFGDLAGDLVETGSRIGRSVAPNMFFTDPETSGNQVQRDVYNAPMALAGAPGTLIRMPGKGAFNAIARDLPPDVAPEAAPAQTNRLMAPSEAPVNFAQAVPEGAAPQAATAEAVAPNRLMGAPESAPAAPVAAVPESGPKAPVLPILTQKGAEARANDIIRHFAEGGPIDLNTSELVPGSAPTLAQATGNPGIATLERSVRDVGANTNAFVQRAASNGDARAQTFLGIAGTPADIEAAETARDLATARLKEAAFSNAQPVDPMPAASKIKEILASPEGKRDVVKNALTSIYNKIVSVDPSSGTVTMETDPAQLYGVRKAINDSISPKAAGTAADARQAAAELNEVKKVLDDVIETGAPGFKDYIKAYSDASRPIDGMRYLQGLNLTDANGRITLAKLDAAIKGLEKQQKLPGARMADSVSPEQFEVLKKLRDDMRREGNSNLGKSLGSNTFQNFSTNAILRMLGHKMSPLDAGLIMAQHPVMGAPIIAGRIGANKLMQRSERLVNNALLERLLDPEKGAEALRGK